MCQPAHTTKDQAVLKISGFQLEQSDDGSENGSTLWLGAQVLTQYLLHNHEKYKKFGNRVVDLGSGIGFSPLVLASLDWNVLATDQAALQPLLARNIANNLPTTGSISVAELDWTVPPENWLWDSDGQFLGGSHSNNNAAPLGSQRRTGFDLITTSDTVYSAELLSPLLRTIHALSLSSSRPPPILLCLERRDPALVDRLLSEARTNWRFRVERIPQKKLSKAMAELNWDKEDWEGVELWKLQLRSS